MKDYELIERKLRRFDGEPDMSIPLGFKLPDGYKMKGKPVEWGNDNFGFRTITWYSEMLESVICEVYRMRKG